MSTNELLLKLATASDSTLAKVDAVLNGRDIQTRAPDKENRLVTYTKAAALLNVSRPTVYRLVQAGRLDVVPLSGVNRITVDSINKLIENAR